MRKLKRIIGRGKGGGGDVGEEEREAKSREQKLYTSSIWNKSILELYSKFIVAINSNRFHLASYGNS